MKGLAYSAVTVLMLLSAPSHTAPQHSAETHSDKNPEELIIAYRDKPQSLDPQEFNLCSSLTLSNILFDKLGLFDSDEALLRQGLVTDISLLNKATNSWVVTLRQGVKFHDGSEFTSSDFVYSVNRIKSLPDNPHSFKRFVEHIQHIETVCQMAIFCAR